MSHTLTEGGQITTHRLRMLRQVMKVAIYSSFCVGLLIFLLLMLKAPLLYYWAAWYYCKAWFLSDILSNIQVAKEFVGQAANIHYSKDPSLPTEHIMKLAYPMMIKLWHETQICIFYATIGSGISAFLITSFFLFKGYLVKKEKHLSGLKITSPKLLAWRLKLTRKASKIKIGPLPLVKGTETRHIMITGSTGSGKTNCLHHLLKQIHLSNQKAVIVDTSGVFLDRYYKPHKDIVLNPFNQCSAAWSPWAEGTTPFDYADIAASFIPHSHSEHENYWREAAKAVFISLLEKLSDCKKTSELNRWIQHETLPGLCRFLAGTPAAAHMDFSSEKTASSIRSVASTFLASLISLGDTNVPFSIQNWLTKEDKSWLFIQSSPKQRAFLRPLMTTWISCAIRGLLALPINLNRRIWFIIDELPTLQRIKDLESLLTEGRKYGGCGVIVLQTPAQLEEIYGKETAQVIVSNTGTKIVFQEEEPLIADRISRSFGEQEISENHEGISYGAHETRDSVSLSTIKKNKLIVSPTQILQLPSNTAYLKLPSGYGVTKIKLTLS